MGKFRGLRKKLLAGLCAFTSCVGGASAVNDTGWGDNGFGFTRLSSHINDNERSILDLDLSVQEEKIFDVVNAIDWQGGVMLCDYTRDEDLKKYGRDFRLEVYGDNGFFSFYIIGEAYSGATLASQKMGARQAIVRADVELNYLARRLASRGYKVASNKFYKGGNDLGNYPDSLANLHALIKKDLADIFVSDVMGASCLNVNGSDGDFKTSWANLIKNFLVPRIDGVPWSQANTIAEDGEKAGQLMTAWTNKDNAGVQNEGGEAESYLKFMADRVSIFNKLFSQSQEFKNSDYYRTIRKVPSSGKSAGYKTAIAFDGILGATATGVGALAWYKHNKGQAARKTYEAERRNFEQTIGKLKIKAAKLDAAKRIAQKRNLRAALDIFDKLDGSSEMKGGGNSLLNKKRGGDSLLNKKRRRRT